MIIIKCPVCGQEIKVVDEGVKQVQCSCGTVIPNMTEINTEYRDFSVDVPDLKELLKQRKRQLIKKWRCFW